MLLDTSGLSCLFDASDVQNKEAARRFRAAPRRVTHSYVLAELVPLCRVRGLNRADALARKR